MVLASLVAASFVSARAAAPDADLRKAEDAWAAAVKRSDAAAVSSMLSDDLVYTHSTGNVDSKSSYLEKMKAGTQKYTDLQYSNLNVRTWNGDTGVITSQLRMIGATNGTPFDNVVYITHVWVKQGNGWKLVAHQSTRKAQ